MSARSLHRGLPLAAGIVLLALALGACRSRSESAGTGTARIVAACQGDCAAIALVQVTVGPGDGPAFEPITTVLAASGAGQWSGRLTGLPAGPGRKFEVNAYRSSGSLLYSGSATAPIVAGRATVVAIQLQGPRPPHGGDQFPIIDSLTYRDYVLPGETVAVEVRAHDPDAGDTLTYHWQSTCGFFHDPDRSLAAWTAPTAEGPCALSVAVFDQRGATVTATMAVTVTSQLGGAVVVVQFRSWPVITSLGGSLAMGADLQGELRVEASSPDGDPLAYAWSSDCTGIAFDLGLPFGAANPHFRVPGPSAACRVEVTVSTPWTAPDGTKASLNLPANPGISTLCSNVACQTGQRCDPVDGTCKPAADPCTGVTCGPVDKCHAAGVCAAGQCSTGAAKTCPAASDLCHLPGTCLLTDGSCSAETRKPCALGQECDLLDGTCKAAGNATIPVPQAAKSLALGPFGGLALDAGGAAYLTAAIAGTQVFDGVTLPSTSGLFSDAALVKYDPATRNAVWAHAFGGGAAEATNPGNQFPVGVAATADGTVVIVGNSVGDLLVDTGPPVVKITIPALQDFVLGVSAASGNGRFGTAVNNGNGALLAVAANPKLNRYAVCGYTTIVSSLAPAGAVFGGGGRDAIVALFESNGALVWSRQLGSPSDEECDALAIDDAGDLFVAGKYSSASGAKSLDPGLGPLPATGLGTRRFLWLAKYDGATGAPLAQASFGSGNGVHTPLALTTDPAGNIVVGGSFTFTLPFGPTAAAGPLTLSASGQDGFVAKLAVTAATFTPVWAFRIGGGNTDAVNAVAATSLGEVLATGSFVGPTNATASGPTLPAPLVGAGGADAFLVKLDATTGAVQFSAAYGDASAQSGMAVAVHRAGPGGLDAVAFAGIYAGAIGFPPPAGALSSGVDATFLVFAELR